SGKRGVFWLHLYAYDPARARRRAEAAARAVALALQGTAPAPDSNAHSTDSDKPDPADYADDHRPPVDNRLIVVTDLGLIVKRALDGSQDVFVQSIRTGRPVAEATVSVLAVNGETLFTKATDPDGLSHFPTFQGLVREKLPVMYVVRKGDDFSFL